MLVGKENVIKWMELMDVKEFRAYNGKNKTVPVCVYEEGGGNAGAIHRFSNWADLAQQYGSPIEYNITAWPKGKPKLRKELSEGEANASPKDTLTENFYLQSPTGIQPQQAPGLGNIPGVPAAPVDIDALTAKIKREILIENELNDLREIKKEYEDMTEGFMGKISQVLQYLPMITGQRAPMAPAMNGVTGEAPAANVADINARIKSAIKRLYAVDQKLPDYLEKLADIAENKPDTWKFLAQNISTL